MAWAGTNYKAVGIMCWNYPLLPCQKCRVKALDINIQRGPQLSQAFRAIYLTWSSDNTWPGGEAAKFLNIYKQQC